MAKGVAPAIRSTRSRLGPSGMHRLRSDSIVMECPVCEYPFAVPYYELTDRFFATTSDRFTLHRCRSCGLLFQEETEALRQRIAEFYPSGYWWNDEGALSGLAGRYREWMIEHDQLKLVRESMGRVKGRRLLDIGCGGGAFVDLANRAGLDAYGLEMSPEAVEIAQQRSPGRIFEMDEDALIASQEQFDILTLFHTLEHVPSPYIYLKKIQGLLRRPGLLYVQVPNNRSLQARLFGSRWYGLDCPRHLYNYSSFSVFHLLGRAGYRVHKIDHFSLRDGAPAMVSSLIPALDPMSQRVRRKRRDQATELPVLRSAVYLGLTLLAQPLAYLEAKLGRGATVKICASLDPE